MSGKTTNMNSLSELERERQATADPNRRIDYAVAGYWDYQYLNGTRKWEEIEALMASASQDGDAAASCRVGRFMDFELQEKTADYHYGLALWKMLNKEDSLNPDEMLAISELYAFGRGVEQDAGKAFFWCRQAARHGSPTAKRMMRHWWQDGAVFPADQRLSQKWSKYPDAFENHTPSVGAFYQTVSQRETLSQRVDVCDRLAASGENKKYKVIDLSKTLEAKAKNPIIRLLEMIPTVSGIGYIVVSFVSFLIAYFAGYQESGFLRTAGELAFFLLGFPFKLFASVCSGLGFEEGFAMTLQGFFDGFITRSNFFDGVVYLVMNLFILAVWFVVVGVVAFFIYCMIDGFRIHGVKAEVSEEDRQPYYAAQKAQLTAALQNAEKKLERLCAEYGIPEQLRADSAKLLALCDIAAGRNVTLSQAVTVFNELLDAAQPMAAVDELFDAAREDTLYAFFFYLRRNQVPFLPRQNHTAPDSKLMTAYRKYRLGQNYLSAESAIQSVLTDENATATEKSWANYLQASVRFLEINDRKTAVQKQMDRAADVAGGCAFWRFEPHYADYYRLRLPASKEDEQVFLDRVTGLLRLMRHELGDPSRRSHWNGYETKNLWAAYQKFTYQVATVNPGYRMTLEDLRKDMKPYYGKGHFWLDKDYTFVCDCLRDLAAENRVKQEAVAARKREVERRMAEFDEKADSFERSVNALRDKDFGLTQEERYWRGTADQQEYMDSWALREQAKDRYRQQVEKELDSEDE